MREALAEADRAALHLDVPVGCVIVDASGAELARDHNRREERADPTAHAELQAIRAACRRTGALRLDGCVMFASGHPCPMCLTAMYLTGVRHVYCAFSLEAGEPYGLSTANIYSELAAAAAQRSVQVVCSPVHVDEHPYSMWRALQDDDT